MPLGLSGLFLSQQSLVSFDISREQQPLQKEAEAVPESHGLAELLRAGTCPGGAHVSGSTLSQTLSFLS